MRLLDTGSKVRKWVCFVFDQTELSHTIIYLTGGVTSRCGPKGANYTSGMSVMTRYLCRLVRSALASGKDDTPHFVNIQIIETTDRPIVSIFFILHLTGMHPNSTYFIVKLESQLGHKYSGTSTASYPTYSGQYNSVLRSISKKCSCLEPSICPLQSMFMERS